MQPDRTVIYLALTVVTGFIAMLSGPSLALLSLVPVVGVVEVVNLVSAPGDLPARTPVTCSESQGD